MPELEVICPIRNGGVHFARTLASLGDQGGEGCSLLVSDNFSTDGNLWRPALRDLDGWEVRVIQPPSEMGRVEHWNWAFGQSSARIVKPVMSGDLVEPGAIGEMRDCFASHPEVSLVFGQNRVREVDKEHTAGALHSGGEIAMGEFVALSLRYFNFIGTLSGVAFNGEVLRSVLPFDVEHGWTADWRLYTRCLAAGPAWYLPRPVCVLDRTISRYSSSAKVIGRSLREEWIYLRDLASKAPGDSEGSFWSRLRRVGFQAVVKYGRVVIPRPIRKVMGACYRTVARKKG